METVTKDKELAKTVTGLLKLDTVKERFRSMLGERAGSFMSSIMSAVHSNLSLKECEPWSVVSSAAIAASLDLPIAPGLGMAHIVPYKGVATFQIGWKGIIQLALRSKQYARINLTDVRDGEITRNDKFTGEMEFKETTDKTAKVVGYLLYFRLLNGYEHWFYMTVDQLTTHAKKYSKTYQNNKGKWVDDFANMSLKTVAKLGLSKYGILSVDLQKAIETDQAVIDEEGKVVEYPDSTKQGVVDVSEAEGTLEDVTMPGRKSQTVKQEELPA